MDKINFANLPSTTTPLNATNMNQLQTNVDNAKVEKCTALSSTDLNTIKDTSFHYCGSTCTNRPSNRNGWLTSIKYTDNYVLQLYNTVAYDQTFQRILYNGTWGDWVETSPPKTSSNANGTAVKFADGTMICYLNITIDTQAINSTYGDLYIGYYTWTFPEEFYAIPVVNCGTFVWGNGGGWGSAYALSKTGCRLRGYDISSRAAGTDCIITGMAIGRWKA